MLSLNAERRTVNIVLNRNGEFWAVFGITGRAVNDAEEKLYAHQAANAGEMLIQNPKSKI